MATEMLQQLLAGQIEGIARKIAAQTGQDVDACMKIAKGHISEMDLSAVAKRASKTGRKKTSRKTKGPVPDECRCKARIWGSGSGNDQCRLRSLDGKHFCKRHQKQADDVIETDDGNVGGETPCSFHPWSEDNNCRDVKGKKRGLFMGRIDQDIPVADNQGVIRIEWNNPEVQKVMNEKVEAGEWRYSKGRGNRKAEGTKRSKKPKKPTVVDHDALEKMLAVNGSETKTPGSKSPDVNALEAFDEQETAPPLPKATMEEEVVVNSEPVTKPLDLLSVPENKIQIDATMNDTSSTHVVDEDADLLGDLQNAGQIEEDDENDIAFNSEDDEEEIEAEEIEFEGETYIVNPSDGTIYDRDNDFAEIGKWDFDEGKPNLD